MRFRFNERKAAQAAAYLLRKGGGRRTYGELIKLLYLADRKKLLECGHPITGDRMVSMPHGTALSSIYDLIRDGPSETSGKAWYEYISPPSEWTVTALKHDPETDELSKYELRILDEIFKQFGRMTFSELRAYTHELPEWQDPAGSSVTISPDKILREEARPQEEIDRVNAEAEELWFLEALAGRS